MYRILVLVVLFSLSIHSHANASFSPGKVSKIILHDGGKTLIYLDVGIITNESCSNKTRIVLKKENQHYDEMYAALLAAYHAGSSVSGWVNNCDNNSPILTRLDLVPK